MITRLITPGLQSKHQALSGKVSMAHIFKARLSAAIKLVILTVSSSIMLLSVSGCSSMIEDDFGRFHTSSLKTDAENIVGSLQEHTGLLSDRVAFHIPLSNNEHVLRNVLAHFRAPFLYSATLRKPLGRQTFSKHKTGPGFRNYMISNIRADIGVINRFNRALGFVISHDMQRYEVISSSFDVQENDTRYIRVRIRENRAVAIKVMKLLDRRISDYDQAVEYARLQYPEREISGIMPVLADLRTKTGMLKAKYEYYVYRSASKGSMDQHQNYRAR